jgi:hypothetical protein
MNGQTAKLIRGVRVEGDQVIVVTKDNAAARFVCGEMIDLLFARGVMERPTRTCRAGSENPCLPCFLDHGECVAPVPHGMTSGGIALCATVGAGDAGRMTVHVGTALPPFDGVEEAQMAARAADQRRGAAL